MNKIHTDDAPASIGPFSQAINDNGLIYVSGQGPIDPETGNVIDGDVREQTARTIENIQAVLEAGDSSLDDVVKATIFVMNMDDYDAINGVYAAYLNKPYPARSAVQVADLPADITVEIEVVASKGRTS